MATKSEIVEQRDEAYRLLDIAVGALREIDLSINGEDEDEEDDGIDDEDEDEDEDEEMTL